jgi:hypothetical protein
MTLRYLGTLESASTFTKYVSGVFALEIAHEAIHSVDDLAFVACPIGLGRKRDIGVDNPGDHGDG